MAVSVKSIKFAAKERKRVMMYFFTPGSEFLFALLGLGIIVWLIGAGGKSLVGNALSHTDNGKPVLLKNSASADGKLKVIGARYTPSDGFYFAEIVDAETGEVVMPIASRSIEEFEHDLEHHLDFWSRNPIYKK